MLNGLAASDASFLADLNNTQDRISRANQQISSGIRVSKASDDPAAVTPLLEDQNQVVLITQLISTLTEQKTVATTGDGALQSASTLLNQLLSIAAQGGTQMAPPSMRQVLAQQVQELQGELVSLANTTVQGRYIFGGDAPGTQPYSLDPTNPLNAVASGSPANTNTISDMQGSTIVPGLSAAQIFDVRQANGSPATGNVFQAVSDLATALNNDDQPGIQAAGTALQAAADHVSSSAVTYGNTENWITDAISNATANSTALQTLISSLRDADIAAAATELSQGNVALQAALSAHASLTTKSLFSYLG